jgi:hypothetical protein
MSLEFRAWPKIPRWKRDVILTEKADGTNSSVWIDRFTHEQLEDAESDAPNRHQELDKLARAGRAVEIEGGSDATVTYVRAGSRNGFVWPGKDNHGFAAWVWDYAGHLVTLGDGAHFGEWYGKGIQRGYGMSEKRFALFNVGRWSGVLGDQAPPGCCDVVPVLYSGPMVLEHGESAVDFWLRRLAFAGSELEGANGFKNPEGIIVYHTASGHLFKQTIDGDENKGPQS